MMGSHNGMINGGVAQEVVSDISDLALTHGKKGSVKGQEDLTLSRCCETERALAEVWTEAADLALTHGSQYKQGFLLQKLGRQAA